MSFKETYDINAAGAERALRGLTGDQEKLAKAAEDATKKLSAEDKAARRIAEAADPMRKFNRELETTAVLVGKGKVSFEEANIHLGKYAERLSGAGRAHEATFGQKAVSQLVGYAAGFTTISTVASGVSALLADIEKNAEGAATRIRESLESVGELQQIEGFLSNVDFSRELRRKGVVANVGEGAKLANSLDQAGFSEEDQRFIAFDLVGSKFLSAADGAEVATKYAKVQGLLQMSSLDETLNKVLEAGGSSSATNPEVADAVTKYGGTMRSLGYNENEVLAMVENADKQSPNIASAAERLKSLGAQLRKRGLNQGSFLNTINAITERKKGGENLSEILGEDNAIIGYEFFDEAKEQEAYRRLTGNVGTSQQRNVLGERLGGIYKDPQLAAGIAAERATRRLEQGREDRVGTLQNLFEAARDNTVDYFEGRGMTAGAYFTRAKAWSYSKVGDQQVYLQDAMREEEYREKTFKDGGAFSKEFEQQLLTLLQQAADAGRRTADVMEGSAGAKGE